MSFEPIVTPEQAHILAEKLRDYSITNGHPMAMEVVKLARRTVEGHLYEVQPFGTHLYFKTHKLISVAELPTK